MGDLIAKWLVVVAGIGGCAFGIVGIRDQIGLMRRGIRVDAKVVGVREHEDGDGDMHFYPIVTFTPPGGAEVQGESYARINAYTPPDTITVVYDPRRPEKFSEYPDALGFVLMVVCSVGLVLLGGWGLLT
ncbi:DUF3592 domain-containing protein [Streptomyces sp. NPDC057540]|uniref:DUF3592 domain-containing protein n=1 Tax=Streptomyces sp. NPDC057540 TaxID=3346160 RepID=UPI0036A8A6C6